MKSQNNFSRTSNPIKGSEKAKSPRTHAAEAAGKEAKKANPQRMDILRRHQLSSRNKDQ
jgi:hypothetical protein